MEIEEQIGQLLVVKKAEVFRASRTLVGFTSLRVAEAQLQTHELQGLADAMGELGDPPEDVVERANEVLEGITEALRMQ